MSDSAELTQKVVLARDLAVGPQGGLRKADETVELPATEARLLLMLGHAREVKPEPMVVAVSQVPNNTGKKD